MQRKSAFSRRLPDFITEEIVKVLLKKSMPVEFKQLFDVVYVRLKEKHSISGGEEMLRLRIFEKLQTLGEMGMVKKVGKKYRAMASIAKALIPKVDTSVQAPMKFADPVKKEVKKISKAKTPAKKVVKPKSPVKKAISAKPLAKAVKAAKGTKR